MRPGRERGQTLILLAIWILYSGGAASALVVYDRPVKELRKAVKRTISDDSRRDTILGDVKLWASIQKQRDKVIEADREEMLKILRRQDAQASDVEPVLAKLDSTFRVMDGEFLDLRFRVKDHVTSEEWSRIVARPGP